MRGARSRETAPSTGRSDEAAGNTRPAASAARAATKRAPRPGGASRARGYRCLRVGRGRSRAERVGRRMLTLLVAAVAGGAAIGVATAAPRASAGIDPAVTTVYPVAHPRGLIVTTGGWAYCL